MSEHADGQFKEGDEFALSPRRGNRIISSILAAGGEYELDGNIVRITRLPGQSVGIKMEASPVASPPAPELAPDPPVASPPAPEPAPTPAVASEPPAVEMDSVPEKATKAPRKAAADLNEKK